MRDVVKAAVIKSPFGCPVAGGFEPLWRQKAREFEGQIGRKIRQFEKAAGHRGAVPRDQTRKPHKLVKPGGNAEAILRALVAASAPLSGAQIVAALDLSKDAVGYTTTHMASRDLVKRWVPERAEGKGAPRYLVDILPAGRAALAALEPAQ